MDALVLHSILYAVCAVAMTVGAIGAIVNYLDAD
jgi:hypothetical protein